MNGEGQNTDAWSFVGHLDVFSHFPVLKFQTVLHQVLEAWAEDRGVQSRLWRFAIHSDYPGRFFTAFSQKAVKNVLWHKHKVLPVSPDDTTATPYERKYGRKRDVPLMPMTASFRGMELPQAIAPLRLAPAPPPPTCSMPALSSSRR